MLSQCNVSNVTSSISSSQWMKKRTVCNSLGWWQTSYKTTKNSVPFTALHQQCNQLNEVHLENELVKSAEACVFIQMKM